MQGVRPTDIGVSSASRGPQLADAPAGAPSSRCPVDHKDLANMKPSQLPFSESAAVSNGTQSETVLSTLVDDFRKAHLTGGH